MHVWLSEKQKLKYKTQLQLQKFMWKKIQAGYFLLKFFLEVSVSKLNPEKKLMGKW